MRRILTRFDVTCIGLNAIVGSGIFVLPDDLYRELGVWSPLAFLCCMVGLLPIAWCYAQAAKALPETGGPQVYARHTFGPRAGFVVGWMCFANSVFSFAAVASAAAAYLVSLWPTFGQWGWQKAAAALIILMFSGLNYRGAKPGARAVNLFTLGKFSVLALMIVTLLPQVTGHGGDVEHATTLGNWSRATFLAVFAAQGFEVVPVPAGETQKPSKDVPFAVLSSLIAASLLYVLVQSVLVHGNAPLTRVSDTPLADAAIAVAPVLGAVVVAGGLISTLGFVSGSALGTPRYLYALAHGAPLPPALRSVHPVFHTPHVAVILTALAALVCMLPFDYRSLIGMSNVAVAVQYSATCLAVHKLGLARARWQRPLPFLGLAMSLWVVTEASRVELSWAVASLLAGALVVTFYRKLSPVNA